MANTLQYSSPFKYTVKPTSVAQYAKMRGVTDFTDAAQFNLYEKGYQQLYVLAKPVYIEKLCGESNVSGVKELTEAFCNILENEFKGASGFDDITSEELEITDNISTLNVIGKVTKQSNAEISMSYTEKCGAVITNFVKYFLEGIRDPRTQAKTYHGLIKNGKLAPGFENEVFTLLYIVTDSTMLRLTKSYLLCNAYPTSAKTSIYEGEKGSIEKVDIDITWKCFLVDGDEVDQRAIKLLAKYNEEGAVVNALNGPSGNEALAEAAAVARAQTDFASGDDVIVLDYNTKNYAVFADIDDSDN